MKNENISYENNPKQFELKLRQNLSSDNHTKDTLIDFGVLMAIEAEIREIELTRYRNIAVRETQSQNLAMQFLNNSKSLDLEQIAKVLEADFGFLGMADLLRKASGKAKSTHGKKSVQVKLEKDPIQQAKKEIEKCYEHSKLQFKRRGYSAQFIRDMHLKYPIITEQKTIAKLVAKLNKANEHIPR